MLRGIDTKEDLLTLTRVTNRVKAALPARALASNAVVPLRTRGQHQTNLGIFEINMNATGADDIDAFKAELLSSSNGFIECVAIEKFPLGPAVSMVVSEEDAVGPLMEHLVVTIGSTVLSYSKKVPRHIGFGHCVVVANVSLSDVVTKGGARVLVENDTHTVGLTGDEAATRVTLQEGVMVELPQIQLCVLGDLER